MKNEKQSIYAYVKLALRIEDLDSASRALLESAGLECLDQGGAFEAYGIAPKDKQFVNRLKKLACVRTAEFAAPPAGK